MDNSVRPRSLGDNGAINDAHPSPRSPSRLLDPLIRFQVRALNDPRHAVRVAGISIALLFLLTVLLGFVFALDLSAAARITLVLFGGVVGLPLFVVGLTALLSLAPSRVELPAGTRPADLRAARRVLRAGTLTGVPAVDRIAAALAAQVRGQRMWPTTLGLCVLAGFNLFLALDRYASLGFWGAASTFFLAVGFFVVVLVTLAVPQDLRSKRRARAVVEAFAATGARGGQSSGPHQGVSDW
ncbi:hypothetical protein [Nocardiopsis sp. SBT366]|uniref:hypothetical protein n=1 Tax=Nocardiopsis sp. SBT366 TaxID=1580529 RepID=UPI00066C8D0A|nr:hypothetical protein [Nocardiopsis sp. SBT366]